MIYEIGIIYIFSIYFLGMQNARIYSTVMSHFETDMMFLWCEDNLKESFFPV